MVHMSTGSVWSHTHHCITVPAPSRRFRFPALTPTTLNVWNRESTALSRASVRARDRPKRLSHGFAGTLSVADRQPLTTDDRRLPTWVGQNTRVTAYITG